MSGFLDAPNMLTEGGYTKQHLENVTNILEAVNGHVCDGIAKMRGLSNFEDPLMWKLVHDHGTFTAKSAQKMGLVDFTPSIDPLQHLIDYAKNDNDDEQEIKLKLAQDIDFHSFKADSAIQLPQYLSLLSKRKRMEERQWKVYSALKDLAEKSTATSAVLQVLGLKSPFYNIDEVRHDTMRTCIRIILFYWLRLSGSLITEGLLGRKGRICQ